MTAARRHVRLDAFALPDLGREHCLSTVARLVLLDLVCSADWRNRSAIVTLAELAEHTGSARRTVATAMRNLETAGLIEVPKPFGRNRQGRVVVLCWERLLIAKPTGIAPNSATDDRTNRAGIAPDSRRIRALKEPSRTIHQGEQAPVRQQGNKASLKEQNERCSELGCTETVKGHSFGSHEPRPPEPTPSPPLSAFNLADECPPSTDVDLADDEPDLSPCSGCGLDTLRRTVAGEPWCLNCQAGEFAESLAER